MVYIPPELRPRPAEAGQPDAAAQPVDQNILQVGAAAALAVIQQEEEERAKALAEPKPKEK